MSLFPQIENLRTIATGRIENGMGGGKEGGLSTIVGIANVWHKRVVKTSWETPPACGAFEPPAGVDSRREDARDEGNEARNRISRSSASRRSSFRRRASPGSHSREVEREIMHWTAPSVRRTEKCHWLPEFRIGVATRSTGEGIVVFADHPPATPRRERGRKSRTERRDQL